MFSGARAALKNDGTLDKSELVALIQKSVDCNNGNINTEISRALLYLRWHFWAVADDDARKLLTNFAKAYFEDDVKSLFWVADKFGPDGELAAPPGSPTVPKTAHPHRVVGRWQNTEYLSSGTSSLTIVRTRGLESNGRFAETRQSSASSEHFDSDGTWLASTSAMTEISPENRGKWATFKSTLWLLWDSGRSATYEYQTSGDSLLLMQPGRENQLWRRT